ncbi:3-keto-5-aminohexanoate cleavage protein [Thermodesulforhabdus norvegica]|uniref:3-keto-5-aminohexanoate cleavage enzyme n=1 Tax=Thermodesulforhabdus norvegica TaxID=39841 RepID=A0A1I4R321_9BACT|nr:3-keto-5-aminohexanoate cleavage protein [Thermodesulforhabdus norvegica]SFM46323.1 3-keto-5-aminohexanoate cleavage enzyme [Thermodesulforhabdus norvegica]
MQKLIITVAPTGSLPRKEQNPHVPVTPQEIVDCALRCEELGASIVHIHVRDRDQNPSDDPKLFQEVVSGLKAAGSKLIIQISTGGRAGSGLESRIARLNVPCEMASLTTGSVNFPNSVYVNPPADVKALAEAMRERGIKPEMEIFDTSMVQPAIDLAKEGIVSTPIHFNFVMGLKGTQPATIEQLVHLKRMIPENSTWTVTGIGRFQLPLAVHAILMGGHVRVGLEDNIYYKKGVVASNEMLVERIVRLAREFDREIATPGEAREILHL